MVIKIKQENKTCKMTPQHTLMRGVPEFSFSSMMMFDSESSMANWYTEGSGSLKGCCFSSSSNILSKVRSNILWVRRGGISLLFTFMPYQNSAYQKSSSVFQYVTQFSKALNYFTWVIEVIAELF